MHSAQALRKWRWHQMYLHEHVQELPFKLSFSLKNIPASACILASPQVSTAHPALALSTKKNSSMPSRAAALILVKPRLVFIGLLALLKLDAAGFTILFLSLDVAGVLLAF